MLYWESKNQLLCLRRLKLSVKRKDIEINADPNKYKGFQPIRNVVFKD